MGVQVEVQVGVEVDVDVQVGVGVGVALTVGDGVCVAEIVSVSLMVGVPTDALISRTVCPCLKVFVQS